MKKIIVCLLIVVSLFNMVACSDDASKNYDIDKEESVKEEEIKSITPEYREAYEKGVTPSDGEFPDFISNVAQSFICASQYCMDSGYVVPAEHILYAKDDFDYEGVGDECWSDYAEWLYDCEIAPVGQSEDTAMMWTPEDYITDYSIEKLNEEKQAFTGKINVEFQINEASEKLVARAVSLPCVEKICFEFTMVYVENDGYCIQNIKCIPEESLRS